MRGRNWRKSCAVVIQMLWMVLSRSINTGFFGTCYRSRVTGPRAEDVFQETWLHVLQRGHQYRAQWKFEVWLFSIARHLVIDLARRKKSQSLNELMNTEEGAAFEPPAAGPSPFEQVLAGEQSAQMARILARIPAAYREVLLLRFQEDLGLDEMATIVGAPLSTVKSRLYRGLDSLRQQIEGAQV